MKPPQAIVSAVDGGTELERGGSPHFVRLSTVLQEPCRLIRMMPALQFVFLTTYLLSDLWISLFTQWNAWLMRTSKFNELDVKGRSRLTGPYLTNKVFCNTK